jgi:hypothetical protein
MHLPIPSIGPVIPAASQFPASAGVDPNFLVIGAQKSGTSWLSEMLKQHPDIHTARCKEVGFFDRIEMYSRGIEWYRAQFGGYAGQRAVGEFTPHYFWTNQTQQEISELRMNPDIPALVRSHYPNMKLILSFRDPALRAVSAYYHHIRPGRIAPTSRILDVAHRFGILSMGYYAVHLQEWLKSFDPEQFLILIYEDDIARNKARTLRRVCQFLDVDPEFQPVQMDERYNGRKGHLYLRLNYYMPRVAARLVRALPGLNRVDFPKIRVSAAEVAELRKYYVDSNRQLAEMLERPLPWPA